VYLYLRNIKKMTSWKILTFMYYFCRCHFLYIFHFATDKYANKGNWHRLSTDFVAMCFNVHWYIVLNWTRVCPSLRDCFERLSKIQIVLYYSSDVRYNMVTQKVQPLLISNRWTQEDHDVCRWLGTGISIDFNGW
jgi:hypothetical protein